MFLKCKSIVSVAMAALLSITFVSCEPEEEDLVIETEKTGYANDQLLLEHIYNNVDQVVERAFLMGESSLKGGENTLASCASVVIDSTSTSGNIHVMIISFGNAPCLGYDGRYRQGNIIVKYTSDKKMNEEGYKHTIAYDGYVFDGYRVDGQQSHLCIGKNVSEEIVYNIDRQDNVFIDVDNAYIEGNSFRQKTLYIGAGTPQLSDDVYRITGKGTFVRTNDDQYTVEITRPLVLANSCNWIREGTINIYPVDATQRVLDYGDGSCENDATINVNGAITNVKVP